MVALLGPNTASSAPSGARLRLVVDHGRPARGRATAGGRRPAAVVGRSRAGGRCSPSDDPSLGRSGSQGIGLDLPLALGLLVAAVVLFGGLVFVRDSQGSPSADSWSGFERPSAPSALSAPIAPDDGIVVARPGDSLWSIAERLAPDSDPRPVVSALIAANGGDSVQIGQQIVIPAQLLD